MCWSNLDFKCSTRILYVCASHQSCLTQTIVIDVTNIKMLIMMNTSIIIFLKYKSLDIEEYVHVNYIVLIIYCRFLELNS